MKNKSTIAKLLSEEDIHVVYKQMETAYFNPKDRELGLPIWDDDKVTVDVEELMVCHEIGHALWTPLDMLEKALVRKINHSFVNIVEDARIERMVQEKYRGSVAVFKRGYRDLTALDFFGIGDKNVSELNLIDRINLFFKKQDVTFSDEENYWVDRVSKTKTPDDVLDLSEELYKWMEENESETDNHDTGESDPDGAESETEASSGSGDEGDEKNKGNENASGDSKSDTGESDSDDDAEAGNSSSEDKIDEDKSSENPLKDSNSEGGVNSSGGSGVPIASTDVGSGIDSLRDKTAGDRSYGRIPDTSKFNLIVSYEELLSKYRLAVKDATTRNPNIHDNFLSKTLKELDTMKKESKKTVSYMVKEFEMKKSADQYARAATAKTGSLDMSALHTYKFNDDLFKKVTTLPGATNHGMVMVLDWSGSMSDNLEGTVSQLFNLIWFCRQTRIPFEVYAFTDVYLNNSQSRYDTNYTRFKSGDIVLREMNLLNMFSSKMNIKEEMEMMYNCLMISKQWKHSADFPIRFPSKLNLGGTPLNESIIAMMDIVPKFKSENRVQKVNVVFLTDGAANSLEGVYTYKLDTKTGGHTKSVNSYNNYSAPLTFMITDPKTNKTYEVANTKNITDTFLQILKERIEDMNIIGFFIAGRGQSGKVDKRTLMYILPKDSYEEIIKKVKFLNKEKYLAISQRGYDEYYILPGGNSLMVESDGLADELIGASKAQLKSAFGKSMKSKISSRQLLNKFVKLVA
tara:strand:+ start:507 stop:2741 length:2235 start_codon:yes stop_codon:yes gene_type:complete